MATLEQIESFRQFADEYTHKEGNDLSLAELVDLWEEQNSPPEEHAENVAAIQAAIDDMNNGDKGRDASEVIQELRDELSLSADE